MAAPGKALTARSAAGVPRTNQPTNHEFQQRWNLQDQHSEFNEELLVSIPCMVDGRQEVIFIIIRIFLPHL